MVGERTDSREGMAVFASDGRWIGSIQEVRFNAPEEATGDAGMVGDPAAVEGSGGDRILALGALGGKDRGRATTTAIGAQRGDVPTVSGADEGVTPGTGGQDVLRGYGMPRSEAGDIGTHMAEPMATGELSAPQSSGGTSNIGLSTEAARGPTSPMSAGQILVDVPGSLNVGAAGLHVPFSALREVIAGDRVILDCTREEAVKLYGGRPRLAKDAPGMP